MTGLPVMGQTASITSYRPGSILKAVPIYLQHLNGQWSASLTGDVTNPTTELVELTLLDGSANVLTKPAPGGRRQCMTKMKDRSEFGYLECNSAFFSVNKASAAAATVLRGVLSLGILTATDAASGNTSFTVSIDQQALDTAVAESKAIELAKESLPLLEYRGLFSSASSSQQLRTFIATFEGNFDPESLVAKAKEKLPTTIELEKSRARQKEADTAQRLEMRRQKEIQLQARLDAVEAFRNKLRPGDQVITNLRGGPILIGMVIEMKPPLAYVQWDNATPATQWRPTGKSSAPEIGDVPPFSVAEGFRVRG